MFTGNTFRHAAQLPGAAMALCVLVAPLSAQQPSDIRQAGVAAGFRAAAPLGWSVRSPRHPWLKDQLEFQRGDTIIWLDRLKREPADLALGEARLMFEAGNGAKVYWIALSPAFANPDDPVPYFILLDGTYFEMRVATAGLRLGNARWRALLFEIASFLDLTDGERTLGDWQADVAQNGAEALSWAVAIAGGRAGVGDALLVVLLRQIHGLKVIQSSNYPGRIYLVVRIRLPEPGPTDPMMFVEIGREHDTLLAASERLVSHIFSNPSHMPRLRKLAEEASPASAPARRTAPVSAGVLNGKAISLPKPPYPPSAKQAHATGSVVVQVIVDENGNVISAHAVSGHPLLQAVSETAAREAKFSPTKVSGQLVKVTGVITYNFPEIRVR